MTQKWNDWQTKKSSKLKSRIRKGIPNAFRTSVWERLAELAKYEQLHQQRYEAELKGNQDDKPESYFEFLCSESPDKSSISVIEHDLNRTFPKHADFQNGEGGQTRLRKVLCAYACHDRDLGYCQGLGFVTALFLMYYDEETAFWMLVAFLENEKYNMRGIYLVGLPLLHQRYFELEHLMKQKTPKLYKKLNEFDIRPVFYASKWFMTIFCYNSNFDCVLKIWDVFLNEGVKIVYRVALALLQNHEPAIVKLDSEEQVLSYIQNR